MAYNQPFEVTAFHSCDRELAMRLLNGTDELRPSNNPWDWLGPGIYFWEYNPSRALAYAEEAARNQQKFSGNIKTPFVIGARIELGNCLNLIDPISIAVVQEAYTEFSYIIQSNDQIMRQNKGADRRLDCAVIRYLHLYIKYAGDPPYDTVRSPFNECEPLYEGSNFTTRSHIEICVRNPTMIKGYFLPRPIGKFNPYPGPPQKRRGQ